MKSESSYNNLHAITLYEYENQYLNIYMCYIQQAYKIITIHNSTLLNTYITGKQTMLKSQHGKQ